MLKLQILLFLSVWFVYGLTINSGNLTAFGLQQAGVETYVERHHFYQEGSRVELLKVQPVVDAFLYNGHIFQPNSQVSLWLAPQPMLRCTCFGLIGLLPLLVYNEICFGNPLLLPNVAVA